MEILRCEQLPEQDESPLQDVQQEEWLTIDADERHGEQRDQQDIMTISRHRVKEPSGFLG